LRKVNQPRSSILATQKNKSKKATSGLLKQVKRLFIFLTLQFFQWSLLFICLYRILPVPITPLHIIRLFEERKDDKETRLEKDWT